MGTTKTPAVVSPKALVLHGWTTDVQTEAKWQPFIQTLETHGITAEFVPIPGLDSPLNSVWSMEAYVAWLAARVAQESQPVLLIGHSFGGHLATRLAAAHPALVQYLVVIDGGGVRDVRILARLKRAFFLILAKLGGAVSQSAVLKRVLYRLAGSGDYLHTDGVLRKTFQAVIQADVRAFLPLVKAPTLIIWGVEDTITPDWMAGVYAQGISGAQLRLIDSARHSPQYTHTDVVVAQLVAWLAQTH